MTLRLSRTFAWMSMALVAVGVPAAFAPRAAAQVQLMMQPLALTAQQQAKLDALHAALAKQLDALKADKAHTNAHKQAALKRIIAKYAADVAAVYTPAQRAVMAKQGVMARKVWAQQHHESIEAHAREVEYNTLKRQAITIAAGLNKSLTADQKQKLSALQTSTTQQSDTINADKTLSDEQRAQKLADLTNQSDQRLHAILSADQYAQFDKIQKIESRQAQLLLGAEPTHTAASTTPHAPSPPPTHPVAPAHPAPTRKPATHR